MKILIVIPYFYPSIGGLQNYALQIAKGLKKLDHEIVVVTTNENKKEYIVENLHNIKIHRLPIDYIISNTPIGIHWFSQLQQIIRLERPDIINAHTPVPFISDIAAIAAAKNNIPFVLTYQNDLVKENIFLTVIIKLYYALLGIPTLQKSHKIIASSEYYITNSKYLKKYKEKTEIVSPGVNLEHFSEKKLNKENLTELKDKYKNKKILLFVGQLDKTHAHKGLSYLLQSLLFIKQKEKNVHLLVIGKGNNLSYYQDVTTSLGLHDVVSFIGFIPDNALPYFYSISDIVVLPSYNNAEGFGMVLIEAGASGKPVVASNIGGIPFVVKNNETGFLTEPKNMQELSDAIITLLGDKVKAEEFGKNNYEWVKNNFTWDKQIKKTNEIFLHARL